MNKTQKGAWFNLGIAILLIAFGIVIFAGMFAAGREELAKLVRTWSLLILIFMGISLVLLRRKQSPAEVDSDERDNLIKQRAVLACFISVWILLVAASITPWFIVGQEGSIPVCLLPIINLGIFLIAMLVYSAAVLIQYNWRGKNAK